MKNKEVLILLIIILVSIGFRFLYVNEVFLDPDESSYAYLANNWLEGNVLYKTAWEHHTPGVYFIYAAVFKFMGMSMYNVRLFTMFYVMLTSLMLYKFGKDHYSKNAGLFSALLYAVYSAGTNVQGHTSNTEIFIVLPLILSVYFLMKAEEGGNYWFYPLSGLFAGIGFLIKQPPLVHMVGILFYLTIAYFIFNKDFKVLVKKGAAVLLGFIVPVIAVALYFNMHDALWDMVSITLLYNVGYASSAFGLRFLIYAGYTILRFIVGNFLISLFGVVSFVWIINNIRKREFEKNELILGIWLIFSYLMVVMGGRFFKHYFILLIPPLCILSAYWLHKVESIRMRDFVKLSLLLLVIIGLIVPLNEVVRSYVDNEYFVEQLKLPENYNKLEEAGEYIKENSEVGDKIYVWGFAPQIYYYAERLAPTKYHTIFPLYAVNLEDQPEDFVAKLDEEAVNEFLEQIKSDLPSYIVITEGYRPVSDIEEFGRLIEEDYELDKEIYEIEIYKLK
ncbi:glycosyltransferase family 39 protein [Candidatus Woesearchaeota archaeon]|nr:glycosyltransferase family 39 protein [Candidatus Woesearchaeota archaeon]